MWKQRLFAVLIISLLCIGIFSPLLQVWQIKTVQATELFNNGFEEGQINPTPGDWTTNTTTVSYGFIDVQNTTKHSGTYAVNATIAEQAQWTNAYCTKTLGSTNNLTYLRQYLYIDSFESLQVMRGFMAIGGTINDAAYLGLTTGRALILRYWVNDPVNTWRTNTSATILDLDTWYCLELNVSSDTDATGDGSIQVYLNNMIVADLTQSAFTQNSSTTIKDVSVGVINGYSANATFIIDDVIASSSYIGLLPTQYSLTINSNPISVSYDINGTDWGYTVYPASGSPSDLQTAINTVHAYGNGTIRLPTGIFSWNMTTENLVTGPRGYKTRVLSYGGINIIGEGSDLTIFNMTNPLSSPNIAMLEVDGENNLPYRISGIKFQGMKNTTNEALSETTLAVSRSTDFRVDNCWFDNFGTGVSCTGIGSSQPNRGVIDHCNFTESYKNATYNTWGYGVDIWNTDYTKWSDIETLLGHYYDTVDCVYIENCWFNATRHAIASLQNGYYVSRYNNFTYNVPPNFGTIDIHASGRGFEAYNNTVIGTPDYGSAQAVWQRGGVGTIYNNTFINCTSGVTISNESAAQYAVNYTYIWSNNMTGGGSVFVNNAPEAYTENVSYFLYARPNYTSFTYPHPFTINMAGRTNETLTLDAGTYLLTVPSQIINNSITYNFYQWQDASTNTTLTYNLIGNANLTATYVAVTTVSISLNSPTNTTYPSTSVNVAFTASGGTIDKKWFNIKNGSSWVYTSNITYPDYEIATGLIDGSYMFYAFANNTAGNIGSATVMFSVQTNPLLIYLTIYSPTNITYSTTSIPLMLYAYGGTINKIWYNFDHGTNHTYTTSITLSALLNATSYTLYAYANNTAGGSAYQTVTFTVLYFTYTLPPLNPPSMYFNTQATVPVNLHAYKTYFFGARCYIYSVVSMRVTHFFEDSSGYTWFNYTINNAAYAESIYSSSYSVDKLYCNDVQYLSDNPHGNVYWYEDLGVIHLVVTSGVSFPANISIAYALPPPVGMVSITVRAYNNTDYSEISGGYVTVTDILGNSSSFNLPAMFSVVKDQTYTYMISGDDTWSFNSTNLAGTTNPFTWTFSGDFTIGCFFDMAPLPGELLPVPIIFIFGMVGLGCMFVGPIYGINKIKQHEYRQGFVWAVIITALGFALFIAWLFGGSF